MKRKLHEVKTQVLPIPTDAFWGIGLNKRSHRYVHKSLDRLLLQKLFDTGPNYSVLLSDMEIGWNLAQHSESTLPHCHRFDVMLKVLGTISENPRLSEQVA